MSRSEFLGGINNDNTRESYESAFKKFDIFLKKSETDEVQFINTLNQANKTKRYKELQRFVNFLKGEVSPAVCRKYFDKIFKYLLLEDVDLSYTQKKIRLDFPRVHTKSFDGLSRKNIEDFMGVASFVFKTYISTLVGAALRETECLLLTPNMIDFTSYPVKIELKSDITKLNISRETFLPPTNANRLLELIQKNKVTGDQLIFVSTYSKNTLRDFEKVFAKLRKKLELETKDKKPQEQNDITLHSFRAFCITYLSEAIGGREGEKFVDAMAGHMKHRAVYYRKSPEARKKMYASGMSAVEF